MTEKRFENRLNKDIKKFHALNPVWDNKLETAWNVFELIDLLNKYDKEYNLCHNDVLRLEKENEQLKDENKEIKTILTQLVNQLYDSQLSLIHEYSTDIANDEKELKKYFQDQYGKYGWKK